jgi:serine/threonine protein kinase
MEIADTLKVRPSPHVSMGYDWTLFPGVYNFLSCPQFLHLCGVVHRDVKPENLMFDGSNRLKLCDFGLAAEKIGQFVKTRSNLAGTPRYMAPEAFKNEPCSEKIDVFAFGMILWEMYTGRLPWAGRSFSEVRSCVSSGTERPAIPSSAPPELARLISGMYPVSPQILFVTCFRLLGP